MAKILIIEDQPDTQALLKLYLTGEGHLVSCADSAQSALKYWQSKDFELVLLDYLLPDGDGLALLEVIKRDALNVPVLMLTACQESHLLEQAFARGATDFLRKPFLRSELLARVNNVLNANAQYRKLDEMYQALNRDLQLAGRVQRLFLPTPPVTSAIDCAWLYQPLEGVSGDGLGLREVTPGHFVFYLVDVSGHGIQSALLMSAIKTCFDSLIESSNCYQPWQLAKDLNKRMNSFFDRHYATILIGSFMTSNGELQIFNAGHPPPLHISHGQVKPLTGPGSCPLGLQALINKQDQQQHYLKPGDKLLVYSDGLFAASDSGFEDFINTLNCWDLDNLNSQEICHGLPQQLPNLNDDDLTLLVLGFNSLSFEKQLSADFISIETVLEQLGDWLSSQKISDTLIEAIRISWLEYGNNLVSHACPTGLVHLSACLKKDFIELIICDNGPAWQLKIIDNLELQAESGRGLWMIQQLSQSFNLTRTDNLNQAQILFKLPGGPLCLSAS